MLLAVVGDAGRKRDIAMLLEDKRGSPRKADDRLLSNFDRSRAAMALGLMGAKEYEPRLVALLQSPDYADRAGAALGLGYMGAKEHIKELAKLLSDDEDEVQTAAMQALAELGAAECAKDIAKLLRSPGDPSVNETAAWHISEPALNSTRLSRRGSKPWSRGLSRNGSGCKRNSNRVAGKIDLPAPYKTWARLMALSEAPPHSTGRSSRGVGRSTAPGLGWRPGATRTDPASDRE
jgi:HEAT repeat protein